MRYYFSESERSNSHESERERDNDITKKIGFLMVRESHPSGCFCFLRQNFGGGGDLQMVSLSFYECKLNGGNIQTHLL